MPGQIAGCDLSPCDSFSQDNKGHEMKCASVCFMWLFAILCDGRMAAAVEAIASPVYANEGWSTIAMGGVEVSPQQLRSMQENNYILHAKDGRLSKVPVQKTKLPHDPCGHVQRLLYNQRRLCRWSD